MDTPNLPTYGKPPVIEVVSGVMFDPLAAFKMPLVGEFWSELLPDFETEAREPMSRQLVEPRRGDIVFLVRSCVTHPDVR